MNLLLWTIQLWADSDWLKSAPIIAFVLTQTYFKCIVIYCTY